MELYSQACSAIFTSSSQQGERTSHLVQQCVRSLPIATSNSPCLINHFFSGVMFPPVELVTPQGYDLTFGTNVLGKIVLA